MTSDSRILFLVPTLGRRPDYLRASLGSIAGQGIDVDLAVVAPPTRIVREMAKEFGARLVEDPGRGGLSGALNAGLSTANQKARYFAWLGDDDLLTPGSLSQTTRALDANHEAVMAYGWCDYIDASGRVVFRSQAGKVASAILRWGPNLIPQPGCLMRLDTVQEVGGLDDSVRLAMDLDLFLRLRQRGKFVSLATTLAQFRWHADSATVRDGSASMEESDQLRMKYMSPAAAHAYRVLRWPGRLALWTAKSHVDRRSDRAARRG